MSDQWSETDEPIGEAPVDATDLHAPAEEDAASAADAVEEAADAPADEADAPADEDESPEDAVDEDPADDEPADEDTADETDSDADGDLPPANLDEFKQMLRWQEGDWYVIHSYAGYEKRVKANLEQRTQ